MTIAPGIVLPEAEIAEICRRHQVKELAVFGSAARGEVRPDSDIDLLVEFLAEARVSLLRHAAAERELSAWLGRRVDLVSKRLSGPPSGTKRFRKLASFMRRERLYLEDIVAAGDAITVAGHQGTAKHYRPQLLRNRLGRSLAQRHGGRTGFALSDGRDSAR